MTDLRPRLRDFSPRAALRVWQRNVSVYSKTWVSNILPNFFEPVIYLIGMGLGLGAYVTEGIHGVPYLVYISPGLLAAAAMNGSLFEATYNCFVRLHYAQTYEAIIVAPVSPEDVIVGEILWGVTRSLIYIVAFFLILLGFSLVPGQTPIVTSPAALLVFVPLVMTGFLFSVIGITYTGLIKRIDLYSYFFTLFVTPMFIFSGIFFPLDNFPWVARVIAWLTPLFHAVRISRATLMGTWRLDLLYSLAYIVIVGGVLFYFALRGMKRKLIQ